LPYRLIEGGRDNGNKILVPLKKHDRLDEIVPCIEEVAEPGASVVFLVHHPVSGFKWLQAYSAISQCGIETALVIRKMIESHSRRMRMQLARRKVFCTCETLHRQGVIVTVDIYAGSLSKTLSGYVSDGDAQLLVMQPRIGQRIASYLQGMVSIRSIFRHPSLSSMFIRPSA
jgi:hypothetical protein